VQPLATSATVPKKAREKIASPSRTRGLREADAPFRTPLWSRLGRRLPSTGIRGVSMAALFVTRLEGGVLARGARGDIATYEANATTGTDRLDASERRCALRRSSSWRVRAVK
jgi:hypothetical protein